MATKRKLSTKGKPRANRNANDRGPRAVSNPDFERYCRQTFNPASIFAKPEVLKGYRVLSCTQYIPALPAPATWGSWARR